MDTNVVRRHVRKGVEMKYRIVNTITGETVDPVELVNDLIERGKLFRLPLLFSGEFSDLQIVSSAEQGLHLTGGILPTSQTVSNPQPLVVSQADSTPPTRK